MDMSRDLNASIFVLKVLQSLILLLSSDELLYCVKPGTTSKSFPHLALHFPPRRRGPKKLGVPPCRSPQTDVIQGLGRAFQRPASRYHQESNDIVL